MTWNAKSLARILRDLRRFGSDNTAIECKRAGNGAKDDTFETIAAFANMPEGGTLLLGIEENANFRVSGVSDAHNVESRIANTTRQAIVPAPLLTFVHIEIEGKTVLVIDVTALSPEFKPARFKNKAYLRQSDGDYVMNENDLRMIEIAALHAHDHVHYDMEIQAGTSAAELDSTLLKQYLNSARRKNDRVAKIADDGQLLQITGVTDSNGQLRMCGLYTMGYLPEEKFPSLAATAAVRVPHNDLGVRTRNLRDFGGPVPLLLEETMDWVRDNISEERAYSADGHMESRPEFPMSAVREILANAFVHRDLGPNTVDAGKRVEIRVLHDRLIIKSPGGLKGLSIAQLESSDLAKVAVNQRVYEIAKRLETSDGRPIIEGEGGGIQEVYHAMRMAGKPDPLFFDNGVAFTVNLLRANRYDGEEQEWLRTIPGPLSWIKKEILVGLFRGETWARSKAVKEFIRVAPQDVFRDIEEMIRAGLVDETDGELRLVSDREPPRETEPTVEALTMADVRALGPNTEAVYRSITAGNDTVLRMTNNTELSEGQVRYALGQLIDANLVSMMGGRGRRGTRYEVNGEGI
ncbi:ATP-binding protein [Corynebacterium pacaense]|uniref:ATP-binding protein n=1 Tax=Corynebacterium pacaense TaxID=1816684 RepID=UPI0009BC6DBD|nr:RNA-binding domain-containing protein [Corynebacterium pacaense]